MHLFLTCRLYLFQTNYEQLQREIVEKYDVQTYIHHVEGRLFLRVSAQVYNTFQDYVKLADAILDISHEEWSFARLWQEFYGICLRRQNAVL